MVHARRAYSSQHKPTARMDPRSARTAADQPPCVQVFGGLDGIITTFAVVAAVAGAELSTDMVTLMGVANLVRHLQPIPCV